VGTPPYAAYAAFEALLRKAATEPIPTVVDKAVLKAWEIAAGNESALLTTLKALGFLDAGGRPLDLYAEIRLSTPRRLAALRRARDRAYPDLPESGGSELDQNQLHDYFVEKRELRGQMVDKAIRFYRQLNQAVSGEPKAAPGPPELTRAPARPRRIATRPGSAPRPPSSVTLPSPSSPEPPVRPQPNQERSRRPRSAPRSTFARLTATDREVHVLVEIPFDASEAELVEFFQRLRRAWSRAAD
jgi:hypothetical protein